MSNCYDQPTLTIPADKILDAILYQEFEVPFSFERAVIYREWPSQLKEFNKNMVGKYPVITDLPILLIGGPSSKLLLEIWTSKSKIEIHQSGFQLANQVEIFIAAVSNNKASVGFMFDAQLHESGHALKAWIRVIKCTSPSTSTR